MMTALERAKLLKKLKDLSQSKANLSGVAKAKILKDIIETRALLGFTNTTQEQKNPNAVYQAVLDGEKVLSVDTLQEMLSEATADPEHYQLVPATQKLLDEFNTDNASNSDNSSNNINDISSKYPENIISIFKDTGYGSIENLDNYLDKIVDAVKNDEKLMSQITSKANTRDIVLSGSDLINFITHVVIKLMDKSLEYTIVLLRKNDGIKNIAEYIYDTLH